MGGEGKHLASSDVRVGDWIKYRSEYYGGGRLAEVHAIGHDALTGPYAVTAEGKVFFNRILEIRRRPLDVVALRWPSQA